MELLNIKNLTFAYPQESENALDSVNITVHEGDFVLLCGKSGCGKTTMLKMLKKELTPIGKISGKALYCGKEIEKLSLRESASNIGFVQQNPVAGIVTHKVWHELAFALENIGENSNTIRKKVGEMATFFGISSWYNNNTDSLSGGQMQILNLASAMVLNPKILLLDEPTSQLDPIAANDFLNMLKRINEELGTTIIITEHSLEYVFQMSNKIAVMEKGKIVSYTSPQETGEFFKKETNNSAMLLGVPSAMRIYNGLNVACDCPVTIKQGKTFVTNNFLNNIKSLPCRQQNNNIPIINLKDIWFRFDKKDTDVLCGLNLKVNKGECYAIVGSNGSGKTTALKIISKSIKPYMGKYTNYLNKTESIAMLPQDPTTVFIKDTVKEDYKDFLTTSKYNQTEVKEKIEKITDLFKIKDILHKHPYDLSGGEQQKCAIGKLLLTAPKILLLDEPTKGLDPQSKIDLKKIIRKLIKNDITIIAVTHDIEFAAETADKCGLMFNGKIIAEGTPQSFFGDNNFYTTPANRISRHMYTGAVTCEQVIELCKMNGIKK